MSYDVYLVDPSGEGFTVEPFEEGDTYALGGTTKPELNVTYNYGPLYRKYLAENGLRCLHGKTAAETLPRLESAVAALGINRDDDQRIGNGGQKEKHERAL